MNIRKKNRRQDLTVFWHIHHTAMKLDRPGIEEMVAAGILLDQRNGLYTPCGLLAEEGYDDAVHLLLENGASLESVIIMYAKTGQLERIDAFQKKYPQQWCEIKDPEIYKIQGYALGNSLQEKMLHHSLTYYAEAIFAYAYDGDRLKTASFTRRAEANFKNNPNVSQILNLASIKGKALAGREIEFEQFKGEEKKAEDLDIAAQYYAIGGYIDDAIGLVLNHNAAIERVFFGLGYAGNIDEFVSLLNKIKFEQTTRDCCITNFTVGLIEAGYFRNAHVARGILTVIDDQATIKEIVNEAYKMINTIGGSTRVPLYSFTPENFLKEVEARHEALIGRETSLFRSFFYWRMSIFNRRIEKMGKTKKDSDLINQALKSEISDMRNVASLFKKIEQKKPLFKDDQQDVYTKYADQMIQELEQNVKEATNGIKPKQ
ncbi:MAG: hypothetical protein A3F12_01115 [Gammaproteobacteria bacterium RIFCSPHIGHO2_12_FULL_38_14]|nr:MAG: hypothetical protein A3F12_01115 [Gammaproteobacteria bacterium RIFCSPHIGHO2_12_FULL_38_14]